MLSCLMNDDLHPSVSLQPSSYNRQVNQSCRLERVDFDRSMAAQRVICVMSFFDIRSMIRFIYLFLRYLDVQLLNDTNGSYYGNGSFSTTNGPDGNTNIYPSTFNSETSPQPPITHHLQNLPGPVNESPSAANHVNSVNIDNQLKQNKDMIYR